MKRIAMTLVALCVLLALTTQAKAQGYGSYGYGGYGIGYGNGYGNVYRNGGYGYGGGFGGGIGWGQSRSYFGNGGHDFQSHWHVTQNPYGNYSWYGNGPHDLVPHQHSQNPWSYQGYSNTGAGPTTSFYNQQPYYFAPW